MSEDRAEPTPQRSTAIEKLRAARLQDPAVRARVREVLERRRRGEPPGPGISAEELKNFLREHG